MRPAKVEIFLTSLSASDKNEGRERDKCFGNFQITIQTQVCISNTQTKIQKSFKQ